MKTITSLLISIIMAGCATHRYSPGDPESISHGAPENGTLENGYRIKYKGDNYKYFSVTSYYLFGNGHVNSRLYKTIVDAYEQCEKTCPQTRFRIMECSNRKGGKMMMHRTHKNGMSVDFMVPKIKKGKQIKRFDHLGISHYLLSFNSAGCMKSHKKVCIDFETLGKHIIALDNAARKNGLKISKVILKIDLKDDLFKTEAGKEIKRRGIYFAQKLPKVVDDMHDDHYHIDFKQR